MRHLDNIFVTAIAVFMVAIGWQGNVYAQKSGSAESDTAILKENENKLIDAVQLYNNGDLAKADALLESITKSSPKIDAAWYYRGLVKMSLRDASGAEYNLKQAVSRDSSNYWYRDMLARLYAMSGKPELTIDIYESLLEDFPKKAELYYGLANLYIDQGEFDKALDTIDNIEKRFGKSDGTVMTKFNILRRQNRAEEAFKSLEEYNEEYASPQVLTMLGDYAMGMYDDSLALARYDAALGIDSDFAPAMLGKAEAYRVIRNYPAYFKLVNKFAGSRNVPVSAKADYFQAVVRQADKKFLKSFKDQYDTTFDVSLKVHPEDSAMLQAAGLYYFMTDRSDLAIKSFRKVRDLHPDSPVSYADYIQLLIYDKNWQAVVAASDSAFVKFPNIPSFLEMANVGQFNLENYEGIIANCKKMLACAPNDSSVFVSALSTMGDMYHQLGDKKKAFSAYNMLLKRVPDYAPVLNNYAYYLSVEGKNLKKAYLMSKKTIEMEPDNATYLDTFGWILYLQGKPEEAKPYFKHAMLYGGKDSATVLEHYAKVLEAVGDDDLAKVYYQQAVSKRKEGKE